MSYVCRMQTGQSYSNKKYGWNSISNSACGPCSLVNALVNGRIADVSVEAMCSYSCSVGARASSGTDMFKLLDKASKKYGFTYTTSNLNEDLWLHLKKGYTAIINVCEKHPWFSKSGGHFIAAIGCEGENTVIVADSLYYPYKWHEYADGQRRSNKIKIHKGASFTNNQVLEAPLSIIGKASIGRNPCYYLIKPGKDIQLKHPRFRHYIAKVADDSPVRAKPSSKSKRIDTEPKGSSFTVVDESIGGNWVRRMVGGWIAKKNIKFIDYT